MAEADLLGVYLRTFSTVLEPSFLEALAALAADLEAAFLAPLAPPLTLGTGAAPEASLLPPFSWKWISFRERVAVVPSLKEKSEKSSPFPDPTLTIPSTLDLEAVWTLARSGRSALAFPAAVWRAVWRKCWI